MLINYIKKLSGGEGCPAERPLRATAHVSCVNEECEFDSVCLCVCICVLANPSSGHTYTDAAAFTTR